MHARPARTCRATGPGRVAWRDHDPVCGCPAVARAQFFGCAPCPSPPSCQVLSCLQRALKLARQAKLQYGATGRVRDATYVGVFVDVLDHALMFWDKGVPEVDTEQVRGWVCGCIDAHARERERLGVRSLLLMPPGKFARLPSHPIHLASTRSLRSLRGPAGAADADRDGG